MRDVSVSYALHFFARSPFRSFLWLREIPWIFFFKGFGKFRPFHPKQHQFVISPFMESINIKCRKYFFGGIP